MREILFRGKRTENGEWVYGFYVKSQDYYTQDVSNAILSADGNHYGFGEYTFETYNEIDVNTLGQYTGLTDKNGTKIFEGDIVKILYTDWASKSDNDTRTLEEYLDSLTKIGVVCWGNLSLCYVLKFKNNSFNSIHCGRYGYIEVIGNIYDNPELLGGENEINND